ncbi:DUF2861 family protein [Dongshaea marina]|uniref:DUF2861 family protein n=1 Tax=Dongshaea marina TaxID=2047966 RepID=UPI000D3E4310|nr:DUF2861 family protein [Dongshaea marina]
MTDSSPFPRKNWAALHLKQQDYHFTGKLPPQSENCPLSHLNWQQLDADYQLIPEQQELVAKPDSPPAPLAKAAYLSLVASQSVYQGGMQIEWQQRATLPILYHNQ